MIRLLKQFFADIHGISEMLQNFDLHGLSISLSQEDRDLLANFRRRKVKKETV